MSVFDTAVQVVIGKEGRYSNDAADPGGETMWGISIARARAGGYAGAMQAMPRATAIVIYRLYYWTQPQFDKLETLDADLAALAFDLGINFGTPWPGKFIQRALNGLNNRGASWPDMTVDGNCFALTRAAISELLRERGDEGRRVLMGMVRAQASVRYLEIAETNPTQERFEYGWQLNRALGATAIG